MLSLWTDYPSILGHFWTFLGVDMLSFENATKTEVPIRLLYDDSEQ